MGFLVLIYLCKRHGGQSKIDRLTDVSIDVAFREHGSRVYLKCCDQQFRCARVVKLKILLAKAKTLVCTSCTHDFSFEIKVARNLYSRCLQFPQACTSTKINEGQ